MLHTPWHKCWGMNSCLRIKSMTNKRKKSVPIYRSQRQNALKASGRDSFLDPPEEHGMRIGWEIKHFKNFLNGSFVDFERKMHWLIHVVSLIISMHQNIRNMLLENSVSPNVIQQCLQKMNTFNFRYLRSWGCS